GKNASLGELLSAGLPVPPGFAVTTDAFETVRSHTDVRRAVGELLGEVDLGDAAALEELSAAIRRRIEEVPLRDDVATDGVVGVDGDREPGRHRQPGRQQLAQAGVLAPEAGPLGRVVAVQPAHVGHRMPSHQSGRSAGGGTWTSWTRLR
ncbi:MAG TPA: PEP/pyruvate-binding domain-containing protein, partial [Actinomycetes bacterium]